MKITRRALFAAVGLLFTDPRKLFGKCEHRKEWLEKCPTKFSFTCNRCRTEFPGEWIRLSPEELNIRYFSHPNPIGHTIYVQRPRRFTVSEGREL